MFETLEHERDARGVATVTLNRPDKHNAMSGQMIDDLALAAERLAADDRVRAVILTGAGRSFCAGADLNWMRSQIDADAATRRAGALTLAEMLQSWNHLPKPVIARVQGNSFGGGIGLMSVCDVVVADRAAKFALTETKLGLIPSTIGPYVVARMGEGMARRVFMSSRVFDSVEAAELGLVTRAFEADALDAAVEAEIAPYLSCAPGAVADAKALALHLGAAPSRAEIEHSIDGLVKRWESAESAEGIAAFFEKRKAAWVVE
jgi:methylglutaconyl-CoA hydratase